MTKDQFLKHYTYAASKNRIGGGSFGTVFKAYDNVNDKDVAIKVQEVEYKNGKELSLMVEYDAIKSLEAHPNIANYERVYRFEDSTGVIDYAVMQFYKSGNLSAFLKNQSTNREQKNKILVQILQGIAYLHIHKVVHRDIKPSNILVVDRPGEGIIPKITDFGLSKRAEVDSEFLKFKNSFAGGTIEYCSPEQLRGSDIKFNTDLWSFGVIIFEVFTGKTVFDVDEFEEGTLGRQGKITEMIFSKDISNEFKKLPKEWKPIAELCLQRNQEKRPATGKDLLGYLPKTLYDPNEDYFLNKKLVAVKEERDDRPTVLVQEHENKDDETTLVTDEYFGEKAIELPNNINKLQSSAFNRKKSLILVLALLGIVTGVFALIKFMGEKAPNYIAMVVRNGKTGYIDEKGTFVIENLFENGSNFGNGLAAVETKTGWNYINVKGETVINGDFKLATPFSEGLALVLKDENWYFINKTGQNPFDKIFTDANIFNDGLAPVKTDLGWQFINKQGKVAINGVFDFAFYFSNGLAPVKKNEKWGLIDVNGNQIIEFKYKATKDYQNDMIAVRDLDDKWIYINNKGVRLFPDNFDGAKNFSEGMAGISKKGKWGFINVKGETMIDLLYDNVGEFVNGMAPVKLGENWNFIDYEGNIVIESTFNSADNFYKNF